MRGGESGKDTRERKRNSPITPKKWGSRRRVTNGVSTSTNKSEAALKVTWTLIYSLHRGDRGGFPWSLSTRRWQKYAIQSSMMRGGSRAQEVMVSQGSHQIPGTIPLCSSFVPWVTVLSNSGNEREQQVRVGGTPTCAQNLFILTALVWVYHLKSTTLVTRAAWKRVLQLDWDSNEPADTGSDNGKSYKHAPSGQKTNAAGRHVAQCQMEWHIEMPEFRCWLCSTFQFPTGNEQVMAPILVSLPHMEGTWMKFSTPGFNISLCSGRHLVSG